MPIAINYRVIPSEASFVLQNVRGDYAKTIIEPAVLRALRTVIGSYELENVASNQAKINDQIQEAITPEVEAHGIEVVYVAIEDTIAKPGIIDAIEAEKIAERNKLTAEHNRDIAKTNADAAINTARGVAESIKIEAEARQEEQSLLGLSPTEYVWYKNWDGILPTTLLSDGTGFIVNLPQQ